MATNPGAGVPLPDSMAKELQKLLPPYISPHRLDDIFDEYEIRPDRHPMPAQHMIADAGGDESPAMMEIARLLAGNESTPNPRIDLSSMPGPRDGGEVNRMDLSRPGDYEPQVVNRDAKRDRIDRTEVSSIPKGIAREAIGQAMLFGYGDDIEGYLTGRQADDIRAERNAFGDANPATSLGSYAGGLVTGGAAPKLIKMLSGLGRGAQALDEIAPPRFEPDIRQAMRNVEGVEAGAKSSDDIYDTLQRLLTNPEARADIRGQPRELSPADIMMMTAGAAPQAGPTGTRENPLPQTDISEHDTSAMSPVDRLRLEAELADANGDYLTEDEKAQNARTNAEAAFSAVPIIGNILSARDAYQGAENAWTAFGEGNLRAGLMQSALAALAGVGAVTGLPTSKAAGGAARGASSRANVFMPAPSSKKVDLAYKMRDEGATNRKIAQETRVHFGTEGKPRLESDDYNVPVNTKRFQPGDTAPMKDVFPQYGVFSHVPELKDIPVTFTARRKDAVAGALPDGRAVLPLGMDEGWNREQLAKLLQYNTGTQRGFAAAATHNMDALLADYKKAVDRVQDIIDNPRPGDDLEAALRWQENAAPLFKRVEEQAAKEDWSAGNRITKRMGGNAEARAVRERSYGKANNAYPYNDQQWQGLTALPQNNLTRDELVEFLTNWRTYGVGRDLFGAP